MEDDNPEIDGVIQQMLKRLDEAMRSAPSIYSAAQRAEHAVLNNPPDTPVIQLAILAQCSEQTARKVRDRLRKATP